MKKITVLSVALLAVGLAAFAETETSATIENVVVRQRWPWKGVVDIDFTVRGNATGVKFVAKYDGAEQFVLAEKDLTGDFCDVLEPGLHHVTWDPAKAGLSETELKNFTISVEPDDTDRTYLILNLYDGSYRYAAAEPQGGWLADPANYQTNIVFRRVPKGTKKLGLSADLYEKLGNTLVIEQEHEVTLTSDYYISVFMTTVAQQKYIIGKGDGKVENVSNGTRKTADNTYNGIRGSVDDSIDWPGTQYAVADGSLIADIRSIVENTFPAEWKIDLPSAVQWEYAAKGTTPDNQMLSVGGVSADSLETLTNYIDMVAIWGHNKAGSSGGVGQKLPNGYGIYDTVGLAFEWVADYYRNQLKHYSGTNPVGPTAEESTGGARLRRSMHGSYPSSSNAQNLHYYSPSYCGSRNPSNGEEYGYRLCIHLKSLFE